ncbi:bifunctional adenosylcobinamide kinase/adenosylcobinamide-phosphate guanylyltransferase [Nonomuraea guangzhouensis]|uniref:Bifunctional adenosylcobinamide kinase/adenosylcobinamide-phosphate guanylyltransferase n=1 Tax=Nonomuraea guangzhouensis TaxID=1291555 RepID=A0ABW4FZ87_9ACTN|nr:bifunctional adenosylcobinamide kinase/adenosylcobinamide-phosphate guanylyltransferase [Nonomuraea guangzhouensis]
MKLFLAGTAATTGWPEPGCPCASCAGLPAGHRRPFELVVDGLVRFPFDDVPRGYQILADGHGLEGPDGTRLLYAPQDMAATPDVPYDVVLVDPLDRPERIGLLRRAGLVADRTQVVAVGLDHRVRSEEELSRRLALWRVQGVPDGTTLDTALPAPSAQEQPRRALLLGGSRSGKSAEAELRLAADPYVTYVATGSRGEGDGEWAARVRAHRERRPAHWATVETTDLAGTIRAATTPLLVDGLGTWLAAVFDEHGAWDGDRAPVDGRCDELEAAWRGTSRRIVAVSDEVGMGVVPATASGRAFRDALGRLNECLAAESEDVALVVAGRLLRL